MNRFIQRTLVVAALFVTAASTAFAHLSYTGRNFGSFTGLAEQSFSINTGTVVGNYGWADGTDDDFGDSHGLRIFRFTLENPAMVTISVTGASGLLPGFSIYSGLAHLSPAPPDYDTTAITLSYLATLPGPAKEGAFKALDTWKVGNANGVTFDDLTTFAFQGYAVDGTAANFGPSPGVIGDGLADGTVSGSFFLQAGDYSMFIGGANYAGQSPVPDTASYGIAATVTAVPEPGSAALLAIGALALARGRRRPAA